MGYLTIILVFIVYKTSSGNTAYSLKNSENPVHLGFDRLPIGLGIRPQGGNPAFSIKLTGDRQQACYADGELQSMCGRITAMAGFPIIYSEHFLRHDTGAFHPEKPGRLNAIVRALQATDWADQLAWQTPTPVGSRSPLEWIEQAHNPAYVQRLNQIAAKGGGSIDADTPISADSYDVALLAVNAWLDGVDRVMATGEPAFALARPPGHHATPETGMGFCLFSNAAIAAIYALQQGAERVTILDWDVHHGNGTQAIASDNPKIHYCSLHEFPHYPGTGRSDETGMFNNVLNLPMTADSTFADYQVMFESQVLPFLQRSQPDLLIISAGYDANAADPLSNVALQPEDFGKFTEYCLSVTRSILFGLEGGYDFDSLGRSVVATIAACVV
jgi:acetoin utilization deacetylase AcuC-like enzyme